MKRTLGRYVYYSNSNKYLHFIIPKISPSHIEIAKYALEKITDDQLINLLKHEVCHWACQKLNKPHTDGSVRFERELLKIGATSSKISCPEKSREYQKNIAKKPEINEASFKNIHIISIYHNGVKKFYWRNNQWNGSDQPFIYVPAQKYEYFYNFKFELHEKERCLLCYSAIGLNKHGKWEFRSGVSYDGEKIRMKRSLTLTIREQAISAAKQALIEVEEIGTINGEE